METRKSGIRVGVIFEHFGPYHVARLRGAQEFVDVVPIELFGKCETYAWQPLENQLNIDREVLFPEHSAGTVSRASLIRGLHELLQRLSLDVVTVHGWSLPGAVTTLKWARHQEVPCVVMSESKFDDHPRQLPKERIKQSILANVSAGLVGAESHREYLVRLGLPAESIFFGYDAVDNEFFREGANQSRRQETELRAQWKLPEKFFFASSRFVEKKNLSRLLTAFQRYVEATTQPWSLVIAGDGPQKSQLTRQVLENGLQDKVHFSGFLQYQQLPIFYGLASAFIHVSTTEQWGLVVNEAAASGLPLIVSQSCGCAPHLVNEGENGLLCDPYDPGSITQALIQLSISSDSDREKMANQSVQLVENFGPRQFGQGLRSAAEYSLTYPRTGSALDRVVMSLVR